MRNHVFCGYLYRNFTQIMQVAIMGFRFRRSVRLFPGVRLNFSGRGASVSVGRKGATLNIGRKGTRATVGLPGTGLSYSTSLSGKKNADGDGQGKTGSNPLATVLTILAIIVLFAIFSH